MTGTHFNRSHSVFQLRLLGSALCIALLSLSVSCGVDRPASQLDPLQYAVPVDDPSFVDVFSAPRYSTFYLASGGPQSLLARTVNRSNYKDVIERLERLSSEFPAVENGLVLLVLSTEAWRKDDAWKSLRKRIEAERREYTIEESHKIDMDRLRDRMRVVSVLKKLAANGSKEATINLRFVAKLVHGMRADEEWKTLFDPRFIEDEKKYGSDFRTTDRREAILQLEKMIDAEWAEKEFRKLVDAGYWPALEAELRQQNEDQSQFKTRTMTAERLGRAPNADAQAVMLAGLTLIPLSKNEGDKPPLLAKELLNRSAERNYGPAYFSLYLYYEAIQDSESALEALRNGAGLDDANCAETLADYHYKRKEYEEAFKLFQIGWAGENRISAYFLGRMYEQGFGTKKDISKALAHFQAASDAGFPLASRYLGTLYNNGLASDPPGSARIDVNYYLALKYFDRAYAGYKSAGEDAEAAEMNGFRKTVLDNIASAEESRRKRQEQWAEVDAKNRQELLRSEEINRSMRRYFRKTPY